MEDSLIKTCNNTYDKFVLFPSKQQKAESFESFYGRLIEQAENCSLGVEETTSTMNMLDYETQKELLKKTLSPTKALELTIRKKMGAQNQQKIHQILKNKNNQSVNIVNNFQNRNRPENCMNRYTTQIPTVIPITMFRFFRVKWPIDWNNSMPKCSLEKFLQSR